METNFASRMYFFAVNWYKHNDALNMQLQSIYLSIVVLSSN